MGNFLLIIFFIIYLDLNHLPFLQRTVGRDRKRTVEIRCSLFDPGRPVFPYQKYRQRPLSQGGMETPSGRTPIQTVQEEVLRGDSHKVRE